MGLKPGNVIQAKAASAAYTDTTAKTLFILPPQAMVTECFLNGTASDAGTTGVVTLYSQPQDGSSSATAFAVFDAKTATGVTDLATLSGIANNRQSQAQIITAIYTETGAAASAGSWTIRVEFM